MNAKTDRNRDRAEGQTTLTVSISVDLKNQLELAAKREERSMSKLFSIIVRGYLESEYEARKNNSAWNAVTFSQHLKSAPQNNDAAGSGAGGAQQLVDPRTTGTPVKSQKPARRKSQS